MVKENNSSEYSEDIVSEEFIKAEKINEKIRIKNGLPKTGLINVIMKKHSAPRPVFEVVNPQKEIKELKRALNFIV